MSSDGSRSITRRTFLQDAAKTGLAAGAVAATPALLTAPRRASAAAGGAARPGMNILFINTDQMRTPLPFVTPSGGGIEVAPPPRAHPTLADPISHPRAATNPRHSGKG